MEEQCAIEKTRLEKAPDYVLRNQNTGLSFPLSSELLIGREVECHLVIESSDVSRYHAKIISVHGQYFIEDLRSNAGTFVNGKKIIGSTQLGLGDEVTIAKTALRVTSAISGTADATMLAPVQTQESAKADMWLAHNVCPEVESGAIHELQEPKETLLEVDDDKTCIMPSRKRSYARDGRHEGDFAKQGSGARLSPAEPETLVGAALRQDGDQTSLLSDNQLNSIKDIHENYYREINVGSGPRLVVMSAPIRGKIYPLVSSTEEGTWTIGRSTDADINVGIDSISRQHAVIGLRGQNFHIQVYGDKSMLVNGTAQKKVVLHHRDKIQLGRMEFEFRIDQGESQSSVPKDNATRTYRKLDGKLVASIVVASLMAVAAIYLF